VGAAERKRHERDDTERRGVRAADDERRGGEAPGAGGVGRSPDVCAVRDRGAERLPQGAERRDRRHSEGGERVEGGARPGEVPQGHGEGAAADHRAVGHARGGRDQRGRHAAGRAGAEGERRRRQPRQEGRPAGPARLARRAAEVGAGQGHAGAGGGEARARAAQEIRPRRGARRARGQGVDGSGRGRRRPHQVALRVRGREPGVVGRRPHACRADEGAVRHGALGREGLVGDAARGPGRGRARRQVGGRHGRQGAVRRLGRREARLARRVRARRQGAGRRRPRQPAAHEDGRRRGRYRQGDAG
jgi:hypothetical protein